jgi:LysM repeat protein
MIAGGAAVIALVAIAFFAFGGDAGGGIEPTATAATPTIASALTTSPAGADGNQGSTNVPRPTPTASPAAPTTPTPPAARTYVVVEGDSLYGLAEANGITIEELLAANNVTIDAPLSIGETLIIPLRQ